MRHLPVLRQGVPYRSVDVSVARNFRTGEAVAEVSQANPGLIRRDLTEERQHEMRAALAGFTTRELFALSARAGELLATATLPCGDEAQTPDDYVRAVTSTTGMPHVFVRRNLEKIRSVLGSVESVVAGLTRGLDPAVLDTGMGQAGGHAVGFVQRSPTLGIVLPNNSPGVHALWAPTVALRTALVLKPGSAEPWTPHRMVQAFLAAGAPGQAFGVYPTDHAGGGEILRRCGRGIVFGDVGATRAWRSDPRVEVHGPGFSKVVLGPGAAEDWPRHLDLMVSSIAENGGRSCVNASGVWTTRQAPEIAEALAERLAAFGPRADDDPQARIAPFADGRVAQAISAMIDRDLEVPGAVDLTARHRKGPRVVTWEGATYLLPTVVLCESPEHPLANREFLFPFASVVPVAPEDLPAALGPTLGATALTADTALLDRLVASPLVNRLSLDPTPTWQVSWDQPHEGNLFEHLYVRRAIQGTRGVA
jgi:acyl-CoA reductase-like NAD-dependent aldehyde dehydrogenase